MASDREAAKQAVINKETDDPELAETLANELRAGFAAALFRDGKDVSDIA